jgi:peptidoglycan hydrolase-like protein with peptidoglycan-binding domain
MKYSKIGFFTLLALALVITGCNKKASDQQASATGFESLSTTEDLTQLPQVNTANQQASIEVLPVEMSPMTQPVSVDPATLAASTDTLSREQKIQTALKNAGLYNGAIDGKIGPASKRAIETFQANNGLKVDGKVGPKTWAALEPYLSGAPASTSTLSTTAE